jgi:SecD/SecF fusion protein
MKTFSTILLAMAMLFGLFSFNACKKKEGMDLKVVLEASQRDLLFKLSGNSQDSIFLEAIKGADSLCLVDTNDYFNLFATSFAKHDPLAKLCAIFFMQMPEQLSILSTNEEVIAKIRAEFDVAVTKTAEVLKGRLEDYDLYAYEVTLSDTVGLISLKLEGVKDTARIMNMIQACGRLEFWETEEFSELLPYFNQADALLKELLAPKTSKKTKDTTNVDTAVADSVASDSTGNQPTEQQIYAKEHPLFAKLNLSIAQDAQGAYAAAKGPAIGYCKVKDTARVNYLLRLKAIKNLFPRDVQVAWTARPDKEKGNMLQLVALKAQRDGTPAMTGEFVTSASSGAGENEIPEVSIEMNAEGAKLWKRLTGESIGKSIAILMDGYVLTFPTVQSEITEGRSMITGNFTIEEASDLAGLIKAGMMPVSVKVLSVVKIGEKE